MIRLEYDLNFSKDKTGSIERETMEFSQHTANANPENHWDKRWYCWRTDPACGLDIAPKIPKLDLKDPTILAKRQKDAT